MRFGKSGALGEGIIMIYRLVLVSLLALVVLGLSSVFYDHYVDVRPVEAKLLEREVIDCLFPEGVLDLRKIPVEDRRNLLSYCGFGDGETERFYVGVEVTEHPNLPPPNNYFVRSIVNLSHGDSGLLWSVGLYGDSSEDREELKNIKKYRPGHVKTGGYNSYVILDDGERVANGLVQVEVVVSED